MPYNDSDSFQNQYDILLTNLQQAAKLTRGSGPCAGMLAAVGITQVDEVSPPETKAVSGGAGIVGVQFSRFDESFQTNRSNLQNNYFDLSIVAVFQASPGTSDVAKQTKRLMEKLWNDRNGHGLGPALRADPTLQQTAVDSIPKNLQILGGRSAQNTMQLSGLVTVQFIVRGEKSTA